MSNCNNPKTLAEEEEQRQQAQAKWLLIGVWARKREGNPFSNIILQSNSEEV